MQQVRDVMSSDVLTVSTEMDIHTLARTLTGAHISGAPVVDHRGHLVGVVSLYDLAVHEGQVGDAKPGYWRGETHLPRGFCLWDLSKSETTVKEIMTPAVYSLDEEAGLLELCDFFLKGEIHRVPVTRGKRLVGIVTTTDLIRCLRQQLSVPAAAA